MILLHCDGAKILIMHGILPGSHEVILRDFGEHLAATRGHRVTQIVYKEVDRKALSKGDLVERRELPTNFKRFSLLGCDEFSSQEDEEALDPLPLRKSLWTNVST